MKIHNFRQLITTPTRSDETSESLIDHIWLSNGCNVAEYGTVEGVSDHAGTYLTFKKSETILEPKPRYGRTYKNFCPNKTSEDFLTYLSQSTYEEEILKEDLDKAVTAWIKALTDACDKNAPVVRVKSRRENNIIPWATKELEALKEKRHELVQKN